MSNLAEWLVENWIHVLWEVHTPYARVPSQPERGRRQNIPGLRQAFQGWVDYIPANTDRRQIAAWQHRHSLGHATSDIAIPSIVIVPEDRHVLISIDHPPTHQVDSTVRFTPPGTPDSWPSEHVWVAKEDFVVSMSAFVDATIERARQSPDIREWTDWLNRQWEESKAAAKDAKVRLRQMFGDLVAERWAEFKKELGPKTNALRGLLMDAPPPKSEESIEHLMGLLSSPTSHSAANYLARVLAKKPTLNSREPWRQGYAAAEWLRHEFQLGEKPISDLRSVLDGIDVQVEHIDAYGTYRSAVFHSIEEGAKIYYAKDDPHFCGVAPARFSIAAALGRLICDEEQTRGTWFGAAQGEQSRLRHSQRANAFAAEFILPGSVAIRNADLDDMCDTYGISRAAAEWHRKNRALD